MNFKQQFLREINQTSQFYFFLSISKLKSITYACYCSTICSEYCEFGMNIPFRERNIWDIRESESKSISFEILTWIQWK